MKWQDYKREKLKNPAFKQAYDELEEEFNLLNEKLSAEDRKIVSMNDEDFTEMKLEPLKKKNLKIAG